MEERWVLRITSKVVFASEALPLTSNDTRHLHARRMSAKNYKRSRLCIRSVTQHDTKHLYRRRMSVRNYKQSRLWLVFIYYLQPDRPNFKTASSVPFRFHSVEGCWDSVVSCPVCCLPYHLLTAAVVLLFVWCVCFRSSFLWVWSVVSWSSYFIARSDRVFSVSQAKDYDIFRGLDLFFKLYKLHLPTQSSGKISNSTVNRIFLLYLCICIL